jgi:trk system potassium uptake protein TrkA
VAIKDLSFPPNSVIAAIIRQGDIVIPRGPLTFQAGDEVLAITDAEGAEELAALFGRPSKPAP